jgi:hypothetical protein
MVMRIPGVVMKKKKVAMRVYRICSSLFHMVFSSLYIICLVWIYGQEMVAKKKKRAEAENEMYV